MEMSEIRIEALDLNQQAAILLKTGKLAEAKEKLERAIELDPMVKESYRNFGDIYMAEENYAEAKNAYKKAFLIKKDGLFYFLYGNACFMNDEVHEGLEHYNLAITHGYDGDEMLFFMGMAYEHLNDENMALRYFQKACIKNPSRPDYMVKKITTEILLNMIDSAEKDVDELLKTAPELYDGYHIKTKILLHKGKDADAVVFAKAAVDRFPEDADLLYDYAKTLAVNKEFTKTLAVLDQATQLNYYEDAKPRLLLLKAQVLAENSQFDAAIEICNSCFAMEDEHYFDGEAHFLAMNLLLTKNDFEKAYAHSDVLVKRNKEDAFYFAGLYYKAFCLRKLGRADEARKAYKEANSIYRLNTLENPNAVDIYLYRAMCLKDMEEYDKALELLDFILDIGVELAEAYLLKAEVYELMGNDTAAGEQREKAYKTKPELRPNEKVGE